MIETESNILDPETVVDDALNEDTQEERVVRIDPEQVKIQGLSIKSFIMLFFMDVTICTHT